LDKLPQADELEQANWRQAKPLFEDNEPTRHLMARLKQPVTLTFKETPLGEVVQHIAQLAEVNLLLDQRALREVDRLEERPVSYACQDQPLESALSGLLQSLELIPRLPFAFGEKIPHTFKGMKPLKLEFVVVDETLWITTEAAAVKHGMQLAYPVYDLMSLPKEATAEEYNLALYHFSRQLTQATEKRELFKGGHKASINFFAPRGALIVRGPRHAHTWVEKMLAQYRAAQVNKSDAARAAEQADSHLITVTYELIADPRPEQEVGQRAPQVDELTGKAVVEFNWAKPARVTAQQVANVIRQLVAPEAWGEPDAGQPLLETLPDCLIIRQTESVQREIEELLKALHVRYRVRHSSPRPRDGEERGRYLF
jgi:hypothetical protein